MYYTKKAWNSSTYAWECDKHCDVDEHLKNCICVKKIILMI